MSTDDTRPHLSGALFEGDGKIVRMVTTDGHRLSQGRASCRRPDAELQHARAAQGHRRAQAAHRRRAGSEQGRGRPRRSAWPRPWQRVFPRSRRPAQRQARRRAVPAVLEGHPPAAEPPRRRRARALVDSLRRISLVASDKSGGVRLSSSRASSSIISENPDVGEGSEELDVDYAGEPLAIGFNARYLLEALSARYTDDEVALELSGELDPGVVKPVSDDVDFVGVIMPMRI